MSLVQRREYVKQIVSDSPGDERLGSAVEIYLGSRLVGTTPKRGRARVYIILAGGSYDDEGYADRRNMFNFDILVHTKSQEQLYEVVDVLLDRLDRYQLPWSMAREDFSSETYSLEISI